MGILHVPVMAAEVVKMLAASLSTPGARLLDMTFGAGGHVQAIVERVPGLRVYALDRDPEAFARAQQLACSLADKCHVIPLLGRFSEVLQLLRQHEGGSMDGSFDAVLIDCGCCSTQMDNHRRGFSLSRDGPLDMRMDGPDCQDTVTAHQLLLHCPEKQLARILRVYGEERRACGIARALVEARYLQRVPTTTGQLAALVAGVCGRVHKDKLGRPTHAATNVFRALRMFVNDELNQLHSGLTAARRLLRPAGCLAVLSFHSLEDRLVKSELLSSCASELPADVSVAATAAAVSTSLLLPSSQTRAPALAQRRWRLLHKSVILPSSEEVLANPRARSAKLRVALRLEAS